MDKLYIAGASEPMLTMILDNLESNSLYPEIIIINNIDKVLEVPYKNINFTISIIKSEIYKTSVHPIIIGVNKPNNKINVVKAFNSWNDSFIHLIHKSAQISSTTEIKKGVMINCLVSVAAYCTIGEFVTINRNVSIGHHTNIGAYSTINPGANIAGFVTIGKGSFIGMGANIIDNISIGSNSIVGAGSLVTSDIPDNVIAYGSPCKIIRKNGI